MKITFTISDIKAFGIDVLGRPKVLIKEGKEIVILRGDYEEILRACLLTGEFKSITHSHYKEVYLRTINNQLN